MILADTSVWIDFFRGRPSTRALEGLLSDVQVATHPWVLGELSLGFLGPRRPIILKDLGRLPEFSAHPADELVEFIEKQRLAGSGLSWVDVQLLYCCLLEDARLWTHDRGLASMAARFGKAYSE